MDTFVLRGPCCGGSGLLRSVRLTYLRFAYQHISETELQMQLRHVERVWTLLDSGALERFRASMPP